VSSPLAATPPLLDIARPAVRQRRRPQPHVQILRPHTDPRAAQIESNYDEVTDSFDNMNLKAELLRGVYAYGFERPSAIQQRAIMPVIKGEFARHNTARPTHTDTR
jgi:hypothetical protein